MYVAVKGGEKAIENAHALLAKKRRGDTSIPEIAVSQIMQQMPLAVDRVMNEGGIYDAELAALAIKQASGDLVEAIFLLRAYRTTLPRLSPSQPVNTAEMQISRRISAIFKDLPGGQKLGATYDYTHRLLDFQLLANGEIDTSITSDEVSHAEVEDEPTTHVSTLLTKEKLLVTEHDQQQVSFDVTNTPLSYPCDRSARLQQLVRGDEGFLLALGYSTQRGYGRNHPFAGEIRSGSVTVYITIEEIDLTIAVGEITLTECDMITGIVKQKQDYKFSRGYGLVLGNAERKAMSMALVDRALQSKSLGESITGIAQDEEFVLSHADNVEACGFVSHLKLPHYVDFQAELDHLRHLQKNAQSSQEEAK